MATESARRPFVTLGGLDTALHYLEEVTRYAPTPGTTAASDSDDDGAPLALCVPTTPSVAAPAGRKEAEGEESDKPEGPEGAAACDVKEEPPKEEAGEGPATFSFFNVPRPRVS